MHGPMNEEQKLRLSLAHKGKKWSPKRREAQKYVKNRRVYAPLSEETKQKLRDSARRRLEAGTIPGFTGKSHSLETRQKISSCQIGKHHSVRTEFKKGHAIVIPNEVRKKISSALRGHAVSEETISKISRSWFKKCHIPWNKKDFKEKKDYSIYLAKVKYLTRKNKFIMFATWDGFCYYTKEYIKDCNGKKKPSIDHKISTKDCYLNNIPPVLAASITNLVICSIAVNAKKRTRSLPGGMTIKILDEGFWPEPSR